MLHTRKQQWRMNNLIIFVAINIFISCKNNYSTHPHNYRITSCQRVEEGYVYSDDVFTYHSNTYSPLVSAEYIDDTLVSIWVFKPDGKLYYSAAELYADRPFDQMLNIPHKRSIEVNRSRLIDNEKTYQITEIIKDSIYSVQKDTLVLYSITTYRRTKENSIIKLKYVDLDIMTVIGVSCDNYEDLFKEQIRTVEITNQTDLDSIIFVLNNLVVDTSNYYPDVRVKIEVKCSDKSQIYCLSNMGIVRDNISYILPDNFLGLLKKHMK